MDLYEYQGKEAVSARRDPVSDGRLCDDAGEARQAAEVIGGPVVVKAQVGPHVADAARQAASSLPANAHEAEEHARTSSARHQGPRG